MHSSAGPQPPSFAQGCPRTGAARSAAAASIIGDTEGPRSTGAQPASSGFIPGPQPARIDISPMTLRIRSAPWKPGEGPAPLTSPHLDSHRASLRYAARRGADSEVQLAGNRLLARGGARERDVEVEALLAA